MSHLTDEILIQTINYYTIFCPRGALESKKYRIQSFDNAKKVNHTELAPMHLRVHVQQPPSTTQRYYPLDYHSNALSVSSHSIVNVHPVTAPTLRAPRTAAAQSISAQRLLKY